MIFASDICNEKVLTHKKRLRFILSSIVGIYAFFFLIVLLSFPPDLKINTFIFFVTIDILYFVSIYAILKEKIWIMLIPYLSLLMIITGIFRVIEVLNLYDRIDKGALLILTLPNITILLVWMLLIRQTHFATYWKSVSKTHIRSEKADLYERYIENLNKLKLSGKISEYVYMKLLQEYKEKLKKENL
jgi:hypothetical protein